MSSGLSSRWNTPLYQACLLEISCIIQRLSLEDISCFSRNSSFSVFPHPACPEDIISTQRWDLKSNLAEAGLFLWKGFGDLTSGLCRCLLYHYPKAFLYPPHTHPQPQDQVTLQPLKPCLPSKTTVKGLTEGNTDLPLCPGKSLSCFFQVERDGNIKYYRFRANKVLFVFLLVWIFMAQINTNVFVCFLKR